MSACRESVTGMHGRTNVRGCCLMCGTRIESPLSFGPDPARRRQQARAQDPLSVDGPDEADYLDGWGGAA